MTNEPTKSFVSNEYHNSECNSAENNYFKFEIKAGQFCPKCKKALIDYDGLLNLSCPDCGLIETGCFT